MPKGNTVTLTGNVVVSQGPNVTRGERLVVDMTTGGTSKMEGGGAVRALINPGSAKDLKKDSAAPGAKPGGALEEIEINARDDKKHPGVAGISMKAYHRAGSRVAVRNGDLSQRRGRLSAPCLIRMR